MESLILLAIPVVVSLLTQMVKAIASVKFSDHKRAILRVFAATASFAGVVGASVATDGEVDPQQVTLYAETLVAFFATQIPYWLGKNK